MLCIHYIMIHSILSLSMIYHNCNILRLGAPNRRGERVGEGLGKDYLTKLTQQNHKYEAK